LLFIIISNIQDILIFILFERIISKSLFLYSDRPLIKEVSRWESRIFFAGREKRLP
jgi:hypothetical protein